MDKEILAQIVGKLGLQFNSLTKGEEIAFIAACIMEETEIEKAQALEIANLLDDLAAINGSALRQKIAREVFGKEIPKGAKRQDHKAQAAKLLANS